MCYRELDSREVVVRKPHRCAWCDHLIEKGEKAWCRSYAFDGRLMRDWMHPECNQASVKVMLEEGSGSCFEWNPGDFPRGGIDPY